MRENNIRRRRSSDVPYLRGYFDDPKILVEEFLNGYGPS